MGRTTVFINISKNQTVKSMTHGILARDQDKPKFGSNLTFKEDRFWFKRLNIFTVRELPALGKHQCYSLPLFVQKHFQIFQAIYMVDSYLLPWQ